MLYANIENLAKIGSGNDLVPDGTKPLPGPGSEVLWQSSENNFTAIGLDIDLLNEFENCTFDMTLPSPRANEFSTPHPVSLTMERVLWTIEPHTDLDTDHIQANIQPMSYFVFEPTYI